MSRRAATLGEPLMVGNDELGKPIPAGAIVKCRHNRRHSRHPVEWGTDTQTGRESQLLAFYKCGRHTYLCGIAGRLLPGEEIADD